MYVFSYRGPARILISILFHSSYRSLVTRLDFQLVRLETSLSLPTCVSRQPSALVILVVVVLIANAISSLLIIIIIYYIRRVESSRVDSFVIPSENLAT